MEKLVTWQLYCALRSTSRLGWTMILQMNPPPFFILTTTVRVSAFFLFCISRHYTNYCRRNPGFLVRWLIVPGTNHHSPVWPLGLFTLVWNVKWLVGFVAAGWLTGYTLPPCRTNIVLALGREHELCTLTASESLAFA